MRLYWLVRAWLWERRNRRAVHVILKHAETSPEIYLHPSGDAKATHVVIPADKFVRLDDSEANWLHTHLEG